MIIKLRAVGLSILLALAVIGLYGQFLENPAIFDDLPFFEHAISSYHFSLLELRSLPYASLAWSLEWFGARVKYFRIEEMLLHAAVVITLFIFLSRFFEVVARPSGRGKLGLPYMAFFAALLFAWHPVATYAAGYLVERTIVMASLFSLLSMLAYLHGSSNNSRFGLWVSVFFYYWAVFSKEHAIMLPAVILAMTMLLHKNWASEIRRQWKIFAAFAAIAIFVFLIKKGMMGSIYEINAPGMLRHDEANMNMAYPLSILTQTWLFFKYGGLWLFPNPAWMSIDMREPFAQSLFSPYLVSATCFIAWGVAAFRLLIKRGELGLLGFGMLFPWLMFIPEFSVVRFQESFVLYRSYLWALGAGCVLPLILCRMSGRAAVILLLAGGISLFPLSMERLITMSHPVLLWTDAEKLVKGRSELPGVFRIYYNRGTELIKIDEYDLAIADLKQAIALYPDLTPAYGNMGAAYLKKHDWKNAVDAFTHVMEIAGRTGERLDMRPFLGRAIAYEELGERAKAAEDYKMSCKLGKKGCDKVDIH